MSTVLPVALALLASGPQTRHGWAEEPPKSWSRTMTSDPATNHALQRYAQPLPDRAPEAVRRLVLFRLLSTLCVGVRPTLPPVDALLRSSDFAHLSGDDRKVALRTGAAPLDYLDYDDVTHLCAGSDYLFGPRGVLIADALSKGNGRLKIPYDPANPYVSVEPFLPR